MDRSTSHFDILGGKISFCKFIDASNIDMFYIKNIGTYLFYLMSFIHIWIGCKITCHTWTLLAKIFLLMVGGMQLRK